MNDEYLTRVATQFLLKYMAHWLKYLLLLIDQISNQEAGDFDTYQTKVKYIES